MPDSRRYQHDCDDCKYLGQFGDHDAYYCPNNKELIARYSDDGPDYISINADRDKDWLTSKMTIVRAMAEEAGYL